MGLADMAMVSRLGVTALAATGMGSLLVWVCLSMGIGLRTAVQTVSSRRLGQKKYSECSAALWNMQLAALIIGIPTTYFCYVNVGNIYGYFLEDITAQQLSIEYSSWVFLGIYFVLK